MIGWMHDSLHPRQENIDELSLLKYSDSVVKQTFKDIILQPAYTHACLPHQSDQINWRQVEVNCLLT